MLPAVQMNEGELAALLMGSKMLEAFQGTPMAEKLTAVFDKLSALLPDNITVRTEELFTRFSFTAPPAMPVSSNVWKNVVQGLKTGRMLEIDYRNWRGELTDTFSRFAGDNDPFKVTVQFSKEIADEVLSRQWHPKQEIKQLSSKGGSAGGGKDGRVQICFDAKGDIKIKRWVMAFGRYAKVKSPKWLKEQITEEARAMLD